MSTDFITTIWEASLEAGLDPFPVHFEVVPVHVMYQLGAYGIPGRFSHWTHGRNYHQLKTRYDYGLQQIYELVLNSDPCQAYLLDSNGPVENKLIAAHVVAHSDFFKNNTHFDATDRAIADTARAHAERIRRYELVHGQREVERLLDAAIALQEHSGPHAGTEVHRSATRERRTDYDDLWKLGTKAESAFKGVVRQQQPARCPERDLLYFLSQYSTELDDWQRDVLTIVRTEWLYLWPQLLTKLTNEGWASYWHREIMRSIDLSDEEYMRFAALHAQVVAPSRLTLNPYHLGLKLWERVEALAGRTGMFEARQVESDASMVRNYLDEKLARDLDLFSYRLRGTRWTVVDSAADDWEAVRDTLVDQLSDRGVPAVKVVDDDYEGNGELYLFHDYQGVELDQRYAQKTLEYIHQLWGRAVHLETVLGDMLTRLTCRGPGDVQIEGMGRYVT